MRRLLRVVDSRLGPIGVAPDAIAFAQGATGPGRIATIVGLKDAREGLSLEEPLEEFLARWEKALNAP